MSTDRPMTDSAPLPPLKPCPFCNTEGEDKLYELSDYFDAGHIGFIHCTHCGVEGPSFYSENGANAALRMARGAWNTRAQEARRLSPLSEEQIRALRAEVESLKLAEEGAKEAFGHVVEQKHAAEAECKRLRALLDDAHAQIRRQAALMASIGAPSEG